MVEVGNLQIGASIDTSELEGGLLRIQIGLDQVESKTDGINSDFQRMANTGSRLVKVFSALALTGGGAMIAISKNAPAVAGSMASIRVTAGELSRSLGRALAPAFEKVSEAFADFVGWVEDNEDNIGFFVDNTLGGFIDGLEGIATAWQWITDNVNDFLVKIGIEWDLGDVGNWLLENFGPEAVGALIGAGIGTAIAGPAGTLPGAAVGAGTTAIGRTIESPEETFERTPKIIGGVLSLLSGFSQSQLNRIIGQTLSDQV